MTILQSAGGFLSLAAAAVAIIARIAPLPHRLHVIAGHDFLASMLTDMFIGPGDGSRVGLFGLDPKQCD